MTAPAISFMELADPNGRYEMWQEPLPSASYVIGADFAYGLAGRDKDTACVLRIDLPTPTQVFEIEGTYGERFDEVLVRLGRFYKGTEKEAFLLGEHQVGGPVMQRMARVHNYRNMYWERREDNQTREISMRYGWHRRYDDVALRNLRRAMIDRKLVLRSHKLLDQMANLEFYHSGGTDAHVQDDDRMRMRLPINEQGRRPSPDLVMAACYAWHAVGQRPAFQVAKPMYKDGRLTWTEAELLSADSRRSVA